MATQATEITAEAVLRRLAELGPDGAEFTLSRGGSVRLRAAGSEILVDRPGVQPISRSELAVAVRCLPLRRVRDLPAGRLHGVSYLFALLRDVRIVGENQPHPTLHIAVADAQSAEATLRSSREAAAEAQKRRDEAVHRASLRGATNRQLAEELGITAEAIGQILTRSEMVLWRVTAHCGSRAPASAFLGALGPIGEVQVVASVQLGSGGISSGPVVVEVPAVSAEEARDEVVDALVAALAIQPGTYELSVALAR